MTVRSWKGATRKDVRSIVVAMRQQSGGWIPFRFTSRPGSSATAWETIPLDCEEVFASLVAAPDWTGRFSVTPSNGRGGAHCDIEIFDRGSHREVTIRPAYVIGAGAHAKAIMDGMIAATR